MMRADHFAFQVADLDRAIAFYTDVLGMKLMFRELDLEHREAFAFLELDGGNLELLQALDESMSPRSPATREPEAPYCPHLAIGTACLAEVVARLDAQGVPLLKGPLEIPGKVKWLYFADPDGNVLEFVEWL